MAVTLLRLTGDPWQSFIAPMMAAPAASRADAVKVTALEGKMVEVMRLFLGYIPNAYGNKRSDDPLGQAWYDVMEAMNVAEEQLEELGEMIRDKAGITWEEARAAIAESQEQPATAEPVTT